MDFEFAINMYDYYLFNNISMGAYLNAIISLILFIIFTINFFFINKTKIIRLLAEISLILFVITISFAIFTNERTIDGISFWHKVSLVGVYFFALVTVEITETLVKRKMKLYKNIIRLVTFSLIVLLIMDKGYVLGPNVMYTSYPQLEHGKFYYFYHTIFPFIGIYNYYIILREIRTNPEFKRKYWFAFLLYNILIFNTIFTVVFCTIFKLVEDFLWISTATIIIYFITLISVNQNRLTKELEILLKEKERLNKKLTRSSLTGVFSRSYFQESYDEYISSLSNNKRMENKHWIAFIDIDKFKKVNDVYGHTVGDEILIEFGRILVNKSEETYMPARYGGDEFIIFLKNCELDEVERFFISLNKDFESIIYSILKDENKYKIGLSIGILNSKDFENELHQTIMKADIAMYSAKENGGSRYYFYTGEKE